MTLRYLAFLIICLFVPYLQAQHGLRLPQSTFASDWHLDISDAHTTTLIFPHDVVTIDRGTPQVLTQTLDEVTNIVKVKAAGDMLQPSSLTVITSGGMVYTFRVCYNANPATLTYHLEPLRSSPARQLAPAHRPLPPVASPMSYVPTRTYYEAGLVATPAMYYPDAAAAAEPELPPLGVAINLRRTQPDSSVTPQAANPMGMSYGRTVLNTASIWTASSKIHDSRKRQTVAVDRGTGSELRLNDIWIVGDVMYYRFTLTCESNISYDIDFWRFYVVDAKQRKRTAVQERDVKLIDVFTNGDRPSYVGSRKSRTFVVAVDKFTIPKSKRLVLEVFELNGGRHHSLKIRNKDIVKAHLVPVSPTTHIKS